MDIKNMLQKAGGLARQHSEKLPRQLRPAVRSAARFLGDREEDQKPPSRTREQQTSEKKPAGTKQTTPANPAKAKARPATRTKPGSSRAS
jgi:hypothetical protein